jgi:hypothetical protein
MENHEGENGISRRTALAAGTLMGAIMASATGARSDPVASRAAGVPHVVLLGDSILDNAAYVGRDPDVRRQTADLLPDGGRATLAAQDGAVIDGVAAQLRSVPADATHLVISAGGNDALRASAVLESRANSVAGALQALASVGASFGQSYATMLDQAQARGLPTAICTIYEPRFPDKPRRRAAAAGLTLLNDRITREAFARGLTLIDLRLICDRDEDFANAIEPSARGGAKIARAIMRFATGAAPSAFVLANR